MVVLLRAIRAKVSTLTANFLARLIKQIEKKKRKDTMLFCNVTRVVALQLTDIITAHGLEPCSNHYSLVTQYFFNLKFH